MDTKRKKKRRNWGLDSEKGKESVEEGKMTGKGKETGRRQDEAQEGMDEVTRSE